MSTEPTTPTESTMTTSAKARASGQTIEAALEQSGITADEAYFIIRLAGLHGYRAACKKLALSPMREFRQRLLWFGGWEVPDLMQTDRGLPAWRFRLEGGTWMPPWPVSILRRLTVFSWGAQLSIFGTYAVVVWRGGRCAYLSPDGTPSHATRFLWGRR